jgi:hypothetical protein
MTSKAESEEKQMYKITLSGPVATLGQITAKFEEELAPDQGRHGFGAEPGQAFLTLYAEDVDEVARAAETHGWRLRMHGQVAGIGIAQREGGVFNFS